LSDYGFDSVMAIHFTSALEQSFGPLPKTLLFEYPTIQSVTRYFLHHYPEQLRSVLGFEENSAMAAIQERVGTGREQATFPTAPVCASVPFTHFRTGANPVPTRFSVSSSGFGASPIHTDVPTSNEYAQQDKEAKVNDIAI